MTERMAQTESELMALTNEELVGEARKAENRLLAVQREGQRRLGVIHTINGDGGKVLEPPSKALPAPKRAK